MKNYIIKSLKNKRIHFIGIGGISMSALAQILLKNKIYIQGSDESENDEVLKLKKKGVLVFNKQDKNNIKNIDIVVYSSAISDDNPELVYAKTMKLKIIKRAELLALIASDYKTVISVAGSHGKTTTAALISEIFISAGLKPTVHIGGVLNKINSNYKIGNKKYFITESCEYKDNFLYLKPDLSVILNIDADHLDFFKNIEGVKQSFFKFMLNTKKGGVNIVNIDDDNIMQLNKSANNIKYGLKNCDIYAKNIKNNKNSEFEFDVIFNGFNLGNIKSNLFGIHNIYNILAAVCVCLICGIEFEIIKNSIECFSGVKRRCEFICEYNGVRIYHDYAHHPKQIEKMIDMGRRMCFENKGKLFVVFEPHTYSRTKFLIDEFAQSLSNADVIYLLPVYSAREEKTAGVDSDILVEKIKEKNKNTYLFMSYTDIENEIFNNAEQKDLILILGAGSVEKIAKNIKNKCKNIQIY